MALNENTFDDTEPPNVILMTTGRNLKVNL